MARRRRQTSGRQRDTSDIATSSVELDQLVLSPVSPSPLVGFEPEDESYLSDVQDLRNFHPEAPFVAPLTVFNTPATFDALVDQPPSRRQARAGLRIRSQTKARLSFNSPQFVAVCVRRHQRRQVLFALRKRGKGSARKHRRRNQHSNTRC